MIIQVTFGSLCRDLVGKLRPIILNYIQNKYNESPLYYFEDIILDKKEQKKWQQRERYDLACGADIIDFGTIKYFFEAELNFLESYNVNMSKFWESYNLAFNVRIKNAHSLKISKEEVGEAIECLKYIAECFGLSLDKDSINEAICSNDQKNEFYIKENYDEAEYRRVYVMCMLFLEDCRLFILSFLEEHGFKVRDVIEGYILGKNNINKNATMVADLAEFIDYDFIYNFVLRYQDELKKRNGWKDEYVADNLLYHFKDTPLANRNLAMHQTDGNYETLINYIRDFYQLLGMDFNKFQHRTNAFANFADRYR